MCSSGDTQPVGGTRRPGRAALEGRGLPNPSSSGSSSSVLSCLGVVEELFEESEGATAGTGDEGDEAHEGTDDAARSLASFAAAAISRRRTLASFQDFSPGISTLISTQALRTVSEHAATNWFGDTDRPLYISLSPTTSA